jgi:hypothetical protein
MKQRFWLSLILIFLSSVGFLGCAAKPVTQTLNLDECISDGTRFQCSGPAFESQHSMEYKDSYGWICRAPETDKAYWDACYLQREVNGK